VGQNPAHKPRQIIAIIVLALLLGLLAGALAAGRLRFHLPW
jgi:hypothetical protein